MSVLDSIMREIRRAYLQAKTVERIVVTTNALLGAVVSLPPRDDRGPVLGEPGATALEVLIHPEDWFALLRENDLLESQTAVGSVYGIPVMQEAPSTARQ